jgi:hypothetical protein
LFGVFGLRAPLLIFLILSPLVPLLATVQPAYAAFTVGLMPTIASVPEYASVSFTVTVTNSDPGAHTVLLTFTVNGVPISGSAGFFTPNPITTPGGAGGSAVSVLSFFASLCPGIYTITVTATDTMTSVSSSGSATLTVSPTFAPLDVTVGTDKPSYRIGETITITMTTNKPADTRLTISGPAAQRARRKSV